MGMDKYGVVLCPVCGGQTDKQAQQVTAPESVTKLACVGGVCHCSSESDDSAGQSTSRSGQPRKRASGS